MRIGTVHEEIIHCPYCGQDIKVTVMPPDFFGDKDEAWYLEEHKCSKGRIFLVGERV